MEAPRKPLPSCRTCGQTLMAWGHGVGPLCPVCLLEFALGPPESSDNDLLAATRTVEGAAGPQPHQADGLQPAGISTASRFAHYELNLGADGRPCELGHGAMGVTYRAWDTVLQSTVALKVVRPEIGVHPRARARFLREAQAAAGLRHPHVAGVFFFGERPEDGSPFYAMELVEGETLEARVRRAGGLPVATVLEIGRQVAEALGAAEARGLLHRDLKPANLMLVEGETTNVKVIDFGLAKAAAQAGEAALTQSEDFVGTPTFASPEQFVADDGGGSQEVDARSDFYALGATLWYALTGRPPVMGSSLIEIRERQLHAPLPLEQLRAARVPSSVVTLLRSLLSADPAGRPQTVRELAAALADCERPFSTHPARSWAGRGLAAALGVLLVGVVLLLAGIHHRTDDIARQNELLQRQTLAQQQQLAVMQAQLKQQTQLIALVNAKIERNASVGDPTHRDLGATAQAAVAQERGVSLQTLQRQCAGERAYVRSFLAQIDQSLSAAPVQTGQWQQLKRTALTRLGQGESAAGHYPAAVECFQQALALSDANEEPLAWCDAASHLVVGLRQSARYVEAAALAQLVVEQRTARQGPEHPATLQAIHDQALLSQARGNTTWAEALFRRVLEAQERTLGSEHPLTLATLDNLGSLLQGKGDLAGAEPLYRRALEAEERVLGPDHHDTLSSLSNLAQLLDAKGDLTAAEPLYLQAQARMERLLSPQNNVRLDLEHYFSLFRERQGHLPEALALAAQAEEGSKALPEASPLRRAYEQHFQALRAKMAVAAVTSSPGSTPLTSPR